MKQSHKHGAATYIRELNAVIEPDVVVEYPVLIGGFVPVKEPKTTTDKPVAKKRGTAAPRTNTTASKE